MTKTVALSLIMVLASAFVVPAAVDQGPGAQDTGLAQLPPGEPPPPGPGPGVFVTTTDNENNAHIGSPDYDMGTDLDDAVCADEEIHPIEFNIRNDIDPVATAVLSILNFDVDSDYEQDTLYFNDHYVGNLSGAHDEWAVNTLALDPSWVRRGNNLVEVRIIGEWCVLIRWGALEVAQAEAGFVPEAGTSVLVASGLASLTGYAGLRCRARRKKQQSR